MCWLGPGGGGSLSGRFLLAVAMCWVGGLTGSGGGEKLFGVSLVVGVEWEERSGALSCRDRFVWGFGAVVVGVDDPGVVVEEGRCR